MQPKPIDSRHLLDVDAQKRLVDLEGIQHLRSVSANKEHPAETDYDVVHDEAGRRENEEALRRHVGRSKKPRQIVAEQQGERTGDEESEAKSIPNGQKGAHLDVKA